VPCKKLIRDSADLQRSYWRTRWLQAVWGWKPELLRPNRKRFSLSGGQGKKNEEVNSSTPGNQCVGGPRSLRGMRVAFFGGCYGLWAMGLTRGFFRARFKPASMPWILRAWADSLSYGAAGKK
jgi:hypothetical protein